MLETLDIRARMDNLNRILIKELEVLELGSKIQSQVQSEVGKNQREYFLREQMKAIQKELGEGDDQTKEIEELREKIEAAGMPEAVKKEALRELDRLSKMPVAAAEYTVSRTYLDWLVALPWNKRTDEVIDLPQTKSVLDADHSGLEKAKDRILEYLAVRKLNPDVKGPILCFVGPPGVGKTSLARSIAESLGRKFVRVSLGGMRDEAEIRGHRRTYIGALPGQIIQGLRRAESKNPVFILDEIDKLGSDFRGDPVVGAARGARSGAEQHVPRSLPRRAVRSVRGAVHHHGERARSGSAGAARSHGGARDRRLHRGREAADRDAITWSTSRSRTTASPPSTSRSPTTRCAQVIRGYTREAGVRNLEREIGALCRKVARRRAEGNETPIDDHAGRRRRDARRAEVPRRGDGGAHEGSGRRDRPGVDAGRRRGAVHRSVADGGHRLADADRPARRRDEGVGAGGAVVAARAREGATASIPTSSRTRRCTSTCRPARFPKDGPSAGVTMATAMASELTGRPVRGDIAMTGEITLSGRVLPVGGIKEKVLAARRVGIREVILPKQNAKNVNEDLAEDLRKDLTVHLVSTIDEVLALALTPAAAPVLDAMPEPVH